jgi:hypothetical protein
MDNYCIDKKKNHDGVHEVHVCSCLHRPDLENQEHLGPFDTCHEAIMKAKTLYAKVNGCVHCCKPCHEE